MRRPYELFILLSKHQDSLSPEGYKFIDITEEIERCVTNSGVITGEVNMHTKHTTCRLVVQEDEKGLKENDFLNMFRFIAPIVNEYHHNNLKLRAEQPDPKLDPDKEECLDANAHILGVVLPSNITLNIENGKIVLGRWESILFAELNGYGREYRTVSVHVSGETHPIEKTSFFFG
jgi:thiamine phosphate synthase YjbQ (UPF0047 family)